MRKARVMERRCEWIIQLSEEYVNQGCREMYLELKTSLGNVINLADGDYSDIGDMVQLKQALDECAGKWSNLVDMGCERYGS